MAYSLSGERPAAVAWPIHLLAALKSATARLVAARRKRVALATLADLDDYRLWDLGIGREDLRRVMRSDDFDIEAIRDSRRSLDVWPPR